ncbi:hypothetical protein KKG61_00410 [bacterium]|nr:hypothetical protein [bacterium]MBU1598566.1 hypothetical protein [bacterium]
MKKGKRFFKSQDFHNTIRQIKWEFYFITLLVGLTIPFLLTANLYAPDGVAYFGFTHSLIIDRDISIKNELDYYNVPSAIKEKWFYSTKEGLVGFPFAIGASLAGIPFFLLGHLLTKIANFMGTTIPLGLGGDSYQGSYLYVVAVSLGNCFYAILGFFFSLFLLKRFFSKEDSLLACITIWFASPLTFVFFYQATYSHLFESLTVAMFVYVWFILREDQSLFRWFCFGLIFALMVMTRWQNLIFGILLLLPPRINFRLLISYLPFLLGGFMGFLPQLITWKIIYGKFLLIPQGGEYMKWKAPEILNLLFSSWHGLYSWTPILIFSTFGLFLIWKKSKRLCIGLIAVFLVQIYVNSCISDWWAGLAFSARRMAGYAPIFMIGLAAFYSSPLFSGWRKVCKYLLSGLAIFYTTNLISTLFSTSDSLAEYRTYQELFRLQLNSLIHLKEYLPMLSSNSLVSHFRLFGIPKPIVLIIATIFFFGLKIGYDFIEKISREGRLKTKKSSLTNKE